MMEKGKISKRDMFNTFNMGVGMTCTVSKNNADKAIEILKSEGINAYVVGELQSGDKGVDII